ncbi:fasciclin domain-containing protein [Noviherbaspirillum sp.]|uniref:fasciclin domain-containing protein n=1 Tax=Noviherbaspirillum sp. TaxID=1926288 RepID=UPI002B48D2EA|nr:fasciclin domain-containing protein [Noviherbaspirillum sp.]HJV83155.1 fasciclin domain-containing protein [Noviherbaspirillum sp.]
MNFSGLITTDISYAGARGLSRRHYYRNTKPFVFSEDKECVMKHPFVAIVSAIALTLNASQVLAADLVDTAATSGTFKTFLAAAKKAGVIDTLKNSGPYTVFAPSDSAFKKLPPETLNSLMKDKTRLAEVLNHHVIQGKVAIADVKPGKVETIQGDMLTLTSDNGKVTVDNANVIQSDLMADNGVIHEIDTVVIPAELR